MQTNVDLAGSALPERKGVFAGGQSMKLRRYQNQPDDDPVRRRLQSTESASSAKSAESMAVSNEVTAGVLGREAILEMQQLYGNAHVRRYLANHGALPGGSIQRDSADKR